MCKKRSARSAKTRRPAKIDCSAGNRNFETRKTKTKSRRDRNFETRKTKTKSRRSCPTRRPVTPRSWRSAFHSLGLLPQRSAPPLMDNSVADSARQRQNQPPQRADSLQQSAHKGREIYFAEVWRKSKKRRALVFFRGRAGGGASARDLRSNWRATARTLTPV